ncbi:MAG: NfeD family protein [Planctomycetota bacterium]
MEPVLAESVETSFWYAAWAWAVMLLLLGLTLVVMEVFIPSGGVLGFLAVSSVVAAVVVGFMDGRPWVGFTILASAVFGMPVALVLALKWWPSTPFGRRMLLGPPTDGEVLPGGPRQRSLKELVDRVGVAKSEMLPSGAVLIGGRTITALSEGMPIRAGQRVRVIEVHGSRVVVRPVDEELPSLSDSDSDPLSRPIDTVGIDPFEDPPA